MEGRRDYRVAGFVFSVEAPPTILGLMSNYEPFVADDLSAEERESAVFRLTVRQDAEAFHAVLPVRTHVFTDSSDEDMPRIEVYRLKGGQESAEKGDWLVCYSIVRSAPICAELRISEDFSVASLLVEEQHAKFAVDNAAMLLFAFATGKLGTLEMHASVTVKDDRGFLFLGKSGTGKSTHSRLWMETFPEAWLLNDDNPIVRLLDNGEIWVYGSPWSGKTPCYKNRQVRVKAIVQLEQAPANAIRSLRLPEAYAYMLCSSSGFKIRPDMMDALYNTISRLIQTVPMYGLACLPDHDAARLCEMTVNR